MRFLRPLFFITTAFIATLIVVTPAYAFPSILETWRNTYPNSTADDISAAGCQLCHANSGGGSPWNAYGWALRGELGSNGGDLDAALGALERLRVDGNLVFANSLDQINNNFQPGWTEGNRNTIYFSDGTAEANQAPPSLPSTTAYDFPSVVGNPIPSNIPVGSNLNTLQIADGFNAPLRAVKAPGINGSLFVVEQTGKIFRVDLASGEKTLFHDVSADLVRLSTRYDERGLLGLAFHPDYQRNGLFYTYQSEPRRASQDALVDFSTLSGNQNPNHRSMLVEYKASIPSCNSTIQKQNNVLIINQPQSNHNGGDLVFDAMGNLYVSLGDGGARDDVGLGHGQFGNGRDSNTVLGTILRIDPLGTSSANGQYSVPTDNPFVANNMGIGEIYAYGFRNPFRMSFDAQTGELYTGDVGQGDLEEIDIVVNGGNYGWNWKEGSFFFYRTVVQTYVSDVAPPNLPSDLVDPIGEYDHDEGISITGGYVYRGSALGDLQGKYIFGDYSGSNFSSGQGRLLYLDPTTSEIAEFQLSPALPGYLTGFGQDANNELYAVTNDRSSPSGINGELVKLIGPGGQSNPPASQGESAECLTPEPSEDICVPISASNGSVAVICL